MADFLKSSGKSTMRSGTRFNRGRTSGTIGQNEQGVVGGRVAVDADGVEGSSDYVAQRFLEERRRNTGVGGDEGESGGHVGMDHTSALGAAHEMDASARHFE